ncbi:MAG: beta-Ala-His dipeptidase [Eubacteriaceae bacterium]|jgi:dipeptidase D
MNDTELLMQHFKKITDIPHGSGNTTALREAMEAFARAHGCETRTDPTGNLLIIKNASIGAENTPPVILQGHLDMVCEKEENSEHDFLAHPLDLRITPDGEWLSAEGTTLGADDGIALSYMLALIESESVRHPKLYMLMTSDEETGMYGAQDLDPDWISEAELMINLDSEEEGVFTVGGAGGLRVNGCYPLERGLITGTRWKITASGLTGGHSGVEMDRWGVSAARLIASLLSDTLLYLDRPEDLHLIRIDGGEKDNVITKKAMAEIITTGSEIQFHEAFSHMIQMYSRMYADTDPDMKIVLEKTAENKTEQAVNYAGTRKALFVISQIPHGIQFMEHGEVRQSLNIGKVETTDDELHITMGLRGNTPDQIQVITDKTTSFIVSTGGTPDIEGSYPSWPEKKNSPLLKLMTKVYQDQYGVSPQIMVIHGGLECGLIVEKLPDLDIVSIGPDLENVHTPEERMHIPSAVSVFEFLKRVLEQLAAAGPEDQGEHVEKTAAPADLQINAAKADQDSQPDPAADESAQKADAADNTSDGEENGPAVITRTSGEVLSPKDVCGKDTGPADCTACEQNCTE